ncbi:MAG: GPW/gp25 family protein [Sphingobacteriaceae bacterium]|nr:GPW/gp25 family protein [Cytophagaceae bacterium]
MPLRYYTLPLRLDIVLKKQQHGTCAVQESIAQHLFLILTTHCAESRFDASFGCSIWSEDFSNQTHVHWKEAVQDSMTESIRRHEKRLSGLRVKVDLDDFEMAVSKTSRRVKRRLSVRIDGAVTSTNEPFRFFKHLFVSPLSYE